MTWLVQCAMQLGQQGPAWLGWCSALRCNALRCALHHSLRTLMLVGYQLHYESMISH